MKVHCWFMMFLLNEDFPCSFLLLRNYCLGPNPRKSSDHQSTHVNTFFFDVLKEKYHSIVNHYDRYQKTRLNWIFKMFLTVSHHSPLVESPSTFGGAATVGTSRRTLGHNELGATLRGATAEKCTRWHHQKWTQQVIMVIFVILVIDIAHYCRTWICSEV